MSRRLLIILAFAFVMDVIVADSMSQTVDEGDHIEYGARILHGSADRFGPYMDTKAPITSLNALPRMIGSRIDSQAHPRIRKFFLSLTLARIPSVFAALGVILFAAGIANDLYGSSAAMVTALMAALSPNLIAHGTLATTDGYFALAALAALYFFRRYLYQPTLLNACAAAIALALAQAAKPLAVYLYVVEAVFLILAVAGAGATKVNGKAGIFYAALVAASSVGVLNAVYVFDRPFVPLSSYHFQSSMFRSLQNTRISNVSVPVPYPVLQGLDMARYDDETGATYGNIYLLGTLKDAADPAFHGFKSYYLVAWLVKEPISLQFLFVWGVVAIYRRRRHGNSIFGEALLLASAGLLVVWLSLFSKTQIGIRHILPSLAIEVIIAGAAFSGWSSLSRNTKAALVLLIVWLSLSTFSYYPDLIPYMNEWVMDRKLSYRVLADSNLDWGQNDAAVRKFLKNNPDVALNPDVPVNGRVLVSVNRLVGVSRKDKPLNWLLARRPIAHVHYGHLLFDVSQQPGAGPTN